MYSCGIQVTPKIKQNLLPFISNQPKSWPVTPVPVQPSLPIYFLKFHAALFFGRGFFAVGFFLGRTFLTAGFCVALDTRPVLTLLTAFSGVTGAASFVATLLDFVPVLVATALVLDAVSDLAEAIFLTDATFFVDATFFGNDLFFYGLWICCLRCGLDSSWLGFFLG